MVVAYQARRLAPAFFALAAALAPAVALAQAPAAAPRIDVFEYVVEGNSLLAADAVERAVTPFMGEDRSLQDIENARAALERVYRDAGYQTVLVTIPEQKVDGGSVQLQVTEAPVGRLRVTGAEYHLPSSIRERLAEVAEGRVPNFNALQESLAAVNRSPDVRVAPVLKPGRVPGTVDVQLEVEDQLPLHGNVELSNRQSLNTTAARLNAGLRYDNLFQAGHSAGITAIVTPQDPSQTRVLTLNYLWPVGGEGDALSVYALYSRSRFTTLYNAPGLGLLGNSTFLGLRDSLPLGAQDGLVQSASFGFDRKQVEQQMQLEGVGASSPGVTYHPLSASYRAVWVQHQPQPSSMDLSLVLGMRGLLGDSDEHFAAKRPGASASFAALRAGGQWSAGLGMWSVNVRAEAQLASGPLLPSEQYVAGGADTVRGYLEGERSGDDATRLSLELALPQARYGLPAGWSLQPLAFVDQAHLRVLQAAAGQSSVVRLAGAGLGLRVSVPRGGNVQIDAARALTDGDVAGGGTRSGAVRVHARIGMEF